jgi:hypothetical protein
VILNRWDFNWSCYKIRTTIECYVSYQNDFGISRNLFIKKCLPYYFREAKFEVRTKYWCFSSNYFMSQTRAHLLIHPIGNSRASLVAWSDGAFRRYILLANHKPSTPTSFSNETVLICAS